MEHYDGTNWTVYNTPDNKYLTEVWGYATDNVYAVGYDGTIVKYDGTSWSSMTVPSSVGDYNLNGISGSGADDIWVVGAYGTLLHYDGSSWNSVSTGIDGFADTDLQDVWVNGNGKVWIAGNSTSGDKAYVFYYDGTSWSTAVTDTSGYRFYSIQGADSDSQFDGMIYAVGTSGLIWKYNGSTWSVPADFIGSGFLYSTYFNHCYTLIGGYGAFWLHDTVKWYQSSNSDIDDLRIWSLYMNNDSSPQNEVIYACGPDDNGSKVVEMQIYSSLMVKVIRQESNM